VKVDHKDLRVSRETVDRLVILVDLLQRWQSRINLIGPSTVEDVWSRHIRDSLHVYHTQPTPFRWADLGSGAGFPGVVTAICLAEQDRGHVHLIESNSKKAAFLRAAIQATGARASVHPERIEAASLKIERPDAVSARALASLSDLLQLTEAWISDGTVAYFHKGRDYRNEVDAARGAWDFDLVEHKQDRSDESVLLEISGLRRR
jgi:16S rRNA (guanine527-N7)-methyltransferase